MISITDLGKTIPAISQLRAKAIQARDALLKLIEQDPAAAALINAQKHVDELNAEIVEYDAELSPAGLVVLAQTVLHELAAVHSVGLQPKPKPGSVTGG